jgi:heme-degrading monooxygenase HmoA
MIRVVYEWRVEPSNIPAFREAWRAPTTAVHGSVRGARGSFLLQEAGDPGKILTVARWDSLDHWRAFRQSADPREIQAMRAPGERASVTAHEELADRTV